MEVLSKEVETKDVMDILHISRPTLAIWLKNGKLKPSRRAGRKLLFDRKYIENFGKEEV